MEGRGEARRSRPGLQWGRDQLVAEIATRAAYSVFNDLEERLREPARLSSALLTNLTGQHPKLFNHKAHTPVERVPAFAHHHAARLAQRVMKTGYSPISPSIHLASRRA